MNQLVLTSGYEPPARTCGAAGRPLLIALCLQSLLEGLDSLRAVGRWRQGLQAGNLLFQAVDSSRAMLLLRGEGFPGPAVERAAERFPFTHF
jgi:hypothetical protein